ncbi:MAG: hypothetical protein V1800_11840, partial [Candidatus Latescibacterota bacterium]
MFRPERMRLARILVMQEDRFRVTEVLAQRGVLHLLDQKDVNTENGLVPFAVDAETLGHLRQTRDRIEALLTHFSQAGRKAPSQELRITPQTLLARTAESLTAWESQVHAMEQGEERAAHKIRELNRISEQLHTLEDVGLSAQDLDRFRHFRCFLGTIPRTHLDRLERALTPGARHYYVRPIAAEEAAVMATAGANDGDAVKDGLEGLHFRAIPIPARFKIP